MFRWSSLVAVVALCSTCFADNVTFLRIDKSVVEQRLQQPQSPDQRARTLRRMFEEAGCAKQNVEVQSVPGQTLPNVLCTLPGSEVGTILVAARLDYDARGEEGAVGWGGVVLLPLLAESLTSANHRHTLVFAAFTGDNMSGASWYWKNLPEAQRREIRGMVDLDHLGRTAAGYSLAGDNEVMAGLLPAAARALQIRPEPQPIKDVPETNAIFFQRAHVPAITVYSHGYDLTGPDVEQRTAAMISQLPGDIQRVPSASQKAYVMKTELDREVYNQTYNLLCVYLLFLDRGLGASKRHAPEVQRAQSQPPVPPKPAETASIAAATTPSAGNAEPAARTLEAPPAIMAVSGPPPAATISSTPAAASASDSNNAPPPTFRVNTRLVQFDVVVTDNQGRPVKDLAAADFTVLQDGQAQTLHAFEFHEPAAIEKAATGPAEASIKPATAALPKETYTNIPAKAPQNSLTIVLFDLLNTGVSDQAFARNQLLQLLRSVPRGEPVALFVLTRHLEMLQGFTQDPDQLLRMAESLDPTKSQVLTTMVERERTLNTITSTAQQAAAQSATPPSGPAFTTDSLSYGQAARIAQGYNDHEAFRNTDRALFTLEAMKGLARAVSGYPGRKNLVWLSGSFPVQIEPDPASTDPFRNIRGFENEIRSTSSLLATSRVAVYPVDVRGLQTRGFDISATTAENLPMNDALPSTAHSVVSTSTSNLGNTLTAESVSLSNDRATMKNIAEQTGGEAFVNTNDLRRVINRSLEDGSTYYTLAYTPPKDDANGSYHRVVVRVPNKNLKLAYRRGYFSIPQPSAGGEAGTAALRTALQPGMPPATSMMLTASIELPDAARKDVKINYIINSNGVNFADVPDNKKRAQIDCMVIAFDSAGKEVAHASDTLDATIPPSIYSTVLTYGLPAHQLLSLPPGKYNLRIGVMDRTTQQIGTVDAPLVVPGDSVAQR